MIMPSYVVGVFRDLLGNDFDALQRMRYRITRHRDDMVANRELRNFLRISRA
jgi:hypothetical protein